MEHGSDYLGAHTSELTVTGGAVRAQLEGDEWVINGRKSMWVSSAMTATHATLFLNIEESGLDRGGIAIVGSHEVGAATAARAGLDDHVGPQPEEDLLVGPEVERALDHAHAEPERIHQGTAPAVAIEVVELAHDARGAFFGDAAHVPLGLWNPVLAHFSLMPNSLTRSFSIKRVCLEVS